MGPRRFMGRFMGRFKGRVMGVGLLAAAGGVGGLFWANAFGQTAVVSRVGVVKGEGVGPKGAVDFVKDVAPLFQTRCAQCHANGRSKGGLKMDTRADLLKGGDSGPAVVPGEPGRGELVKRIVSTDPDDVMPRKGKKLSAEEVATVKAWISAGAPWPAGVVVGKMNEAPLEPRRPVVPPGPAGSGLANPIDLLLRPYFEAHGVKPAAVVDDRVYARRVYLDVIGILPAPEELRAFADDGSPDKREQLARRLLDDDRRYAGHWLAFWNDLLRNDYQGTGYIDGGREQITGWLFHALETNMAYDEFVRQLVVGEGGDKGAGGFTKGIVWRGVVNSSQTPPMQASQNISQVMMGINIKCASCHDSFINNWKLTDSYGLAGVYADRPLEIERCGVPTGAVAPAKFLYPQLGAIDGGAPRARRLRQLAAALTSPRNGRLTRTIVNRLWQRCMGRGLIEPTDEMDNPAWDADVLDEVSVELSDHGFDLKRTLLTILTSRAYQLPAVIQEGGGGDHFVFRGPLVRRMTAEQFVDAVSGVTGVAAGKPAGALPAEVKRAAAADRRTAFCPADPLTTALGRPSREQVVTERASAATTLQGLELTNGPTLSAVLRKGAALYAADKTATPEGLITRLYQRALGRDPTAGEMKTATGVVGSPASPQGMEDLMWAVFMLPEFQLIR